MWRIKMLVLFMYFRQNSHRYSLGSLQQIEIAISASINECTTYTSLPQYTDLIGESLQE